MRPTQLASTTVPPRENEASGVSRLIAGARARGSNADVLAAIHSDVVRVSAAIEPGEQTRAERASTKRPRRSQPETCPGDSGTLLSPAVVAQMLGVTRGTLRTMRHQKRGPDFVKERGARGVWYYEDVVNGYRRDHFQFVDL